MIYLENKDLSSVNAEMYIIPHATDGTTSSYINDFLVRIGQSDQVPINSNLGDIEVIRNQKENILYLAFICTDQELSSSYALIYKIVKELLSKLPPWESDLWQLRYMAQAMWAWIQKRCMK
jgi:hypothetical protein